MTASLDQQMEAASEALVRMAYHECESLCLEALATARASAQWAYYARILLPLQEARRQIRMMAADGDVRLGTDGLNDDATAWLGDRQAACIVTTGPRGVAQAAALQAWARQAGRNVEVLRAQRDNDTRQWTLHGVAASPVTCAYEAPPANWCDTWLTSGEHTDAGRTPADWFLDACEALGDAALARVDADTNLTPGSLPHLVAIESCLTVVPNHEIIHQRLGHAARAMLRPTTSTAPKQ